MNVELKEHIGKSMASNREVKNKQYRILVDGKHAGYVAFHDGAPICLTRRFGPIEKKEIESQVATLLPGKRKPTGMAPEVPEELMKKDNREEFADANDFDA